MGQPLGLAADAHYSPGFEKSLDSLTGCWIWRSFQPDSGSWQQTNLAESMRPAPEQHREDLNLPPVSNDVCGLTSFTALIPLCLGNSSWHQPPQITFGGIYPALLYWPFEVWPFLPVSFLAQQPQPPFQLAEQSRDVTVKAEEAGKLWRPLVSPAEQQLLLRPQGEQTRPHFEATQWQDQCLPKPGNQRRPSCPEDQQQQRQQSPCSGKQFWEQEQQPSSISIWELPSSRPWPAFRPLPGNGLPSPIDSTPAQIEDLPAPEVLPLWSRQESMPMLTEETQLAFLRWLEEEPLENKGFF
jgi:hypothetical protein